MQNQRIIVCLLALAFACPSVVWAQHGFAYPDRESNPAANLQAATVPAPQYHHPESARHNDAVQQAAYQASQVSASRIDTSSYANDTSFPSLTPQSRSSGTETAGQGSSFGPLMTTGFSLAIVLGLFAGLVWVTRRFGNGSMTQSGLSSEVVKSLGSTAIDARTRVTLLRCGERVIVMAQTASGVHPLSEITDPAEVRRLTTALTGAATPTFAETLRETEPQRGSLFTA